jgi:hypothetical protein
MPRKDETKVSGLWQREKGSGIWWIRYREDGLISRRRILEQSLQK